MTCTYPILYRYIYSTKPLPLLPFSPPALLPIFLRCPGIARVAPRCTVVDVDVSHAVHRIISHIPPVIIIGPISGEGIAVDGAVDAVVAVDRAIVIVVVPPDHKAVRAIRVSTIDHATVVVVAVVDDVVPTNLGRPAIDSAVRAVMVVIPADHRMASATAGDVKIAAARA